MDGCRVAWLTMTGLAFLGLAGCSEPLPAIKIAEPLSADEEKRWNELWKQGSEPAGNGDTASPAGNSANSTR